MTIVTGIVVYILVWWISLFIILPIGIRTEEKPNKGMAWGHPKPFSLKRKLLFSTIVSVFVWFFIFFFVESNLISFRWDPTNAAFG